MEQLLKQRYMSNRLLILKLIRDKVRLSRSELAQITGLTRPTISAIVNSFNSEGLVLDLGKGESTGGKPPIMVELNSSYCYVIGIDLSDDNEINGVLCDFSGNIIEQIKLSYDNNLDDILKVLIEIIEILRKSVSPGKLKGVGIAVSGIVDRLANEIIGSTNLDIQNCELSKTLEDICGLPVLLENRPNAAALAETRFGAGKRAQNLVYITSGGGVGAGIVIDGEIFCGSFGAAGEIGDMLLPKSSTGNGKNSSQLEEFIRTRSITEQVENIKKKIMSFDDIIVAYYADDTDINNVIRENAKYMAYASQIVANLLNPEFIVLGGRAIELGEKYLNHFNEYFEEGLIQGPLTGKTVAVYSHFGHLGVAVGGAAIVLEEIINLEK